MNVILAALILAWVIVYYSHKVFFDGEPSLHQLLKAYLSSHTWRK
jgi:hypothetical protein